MAKVFTSSQIVSAAALVLGVWQAVPAFQEYTENQEEAQSRQEVIDEAAEEDKQRDRDRQLSSDLAMDRVQGHCVIAFLAETNRPAQTIRTGIDARMVNPDGVPLTPGIPVCAEDGSTAVTIRVPEGVGLADFAFASRDDHPEYLEYYRKNLRREENDNAG